MSSRRSQLCLEIGIAAYCLGTGLHALRYQPPAFSFLFQGLDWSSGATQAFVQWAAGLLIATAALVFYRPLRPLALLAFLWVALEVGTRFYTKPAFYEISPATAALRWGAPIALLLLGRGHERAAAWLLRIAAAAVFATHGIEAFAEHPEFVDYIITAGMRIGLDIEESGAGACLFVIGVVDLIAAAALLLRPWRPILYYMIVWGLVTALARVVHSGWHGATDCLVRIIHGTGPWALLLLIPPTPSQPSREPD